MTLMNKDRLIVALDFDSAEKAKQMVDELGDSVVFYKVGLELLGTGDYFHFIDWLIKQNKKIFADLKFYDIPATVAAGVKQISKYGVSYLTVHGDKQIMQAATDAKSNKLKVLAVTVLTSLDNNDIRAMGYQLSLTDLVELKVQQAISSNVDGVICSTQEVATIKENHGSKLIAITPGIRLANDESHDQKRVATPSFAISNGANHIVVGRSITASEQPRAVAEKIQNSISSL
jgi:orotidine-5'-phosphate decarboxylase